MERDLAHAWKTRHTVWTWVVRGTAGKCRLLWKLDEKSAATWALRNGLKLERVEGSSQNRFSANRPPRSRRA